MAVSVFTQSPRGDQTIAQINITPLVDVMLLLLVMFMVTAPVSTDTLDLRLPQAPTRQMDAPLKFDAGADAEHQGFARALGAARASELENIAFPQ